MGVRVRVRVRMSLSRMAMTCWLGVRDRVGVRG